MLKSIGVPDITPIFIFKMCVSPIRIRNPNKGSKLPYAFLKDTTSEFINIPCGHCHECVAVRQMAIVQRVQMESLEYHIFFNTLTYNNESLPHVSTSSGFDLAYADISDVQNMIKRIRKYDRFGRPFRYFCVSELGSSRGRPHFHILWFVKKYDGDTYNDCLNLQKILFDAVLLEWRRNYGSTRSPDYRPLCTYVSKLVRGKLKSTFDLHYCNPSLSKGSTNDVSFYVTKYMIKPSDRAVRLQQALRLNLSSDEYEDIWPMIKPRWCSSLRFGRNSSADKYIRDCVSRSKSISEFPLFYNPVDGKSFPLARYYKSHGDLYSIQDHLDFFYNSSSPADNVVYDEHDPSRVDVALEMFDKRLDLVDSHDESEVFNELFDYA